MGVFDADMGLEAMPESQTQRCKPDYEKLIKIQKSKFDVSYQLKNSILEYLDVYGVNSSCRKEFTLPSLLGGLELDIRYGAITIDKLIQQQEQDKDA